MAEIRYIVAGRLIDGTGAEVRRNVVLTVEDGLITAINAATDLSLSADAVIEDFSHCTILPALVDCSVNLAWSPSVDDATRNGVAEGDVVKKVKLVAHHLRDCHGHGVLGVADSDDLSAMLTQYQSEISHRPIIAIRTSGGMVQSPTDCPAHRSCHADFLKIAYSPNIGEDEFLYPQLHGENLALALHQREGKKAVVIANGRQHVAEALVAGCDAIEQGYGMGEENLKKMAEQNILWIPSVLRAKNGLDGASTGGEVCCRFSLRYVAPGKPIPGAEAFWKKTLAEQLNQLRLAREYGVKTAVGTGAGNVGMLHGESVVDEMKLFMKAGYTLEEAVQCASVNGARFFGMENLGSLTVGRKANFIITRGTPKQLPRKLSYLEGVYVDGVSSII